MKQSSLTLGKLITTAVVAIVGLFVLLQLGRVVENVNPNEIVVIQAPISGKLTWHTTPGTKWQGFGAVTSYEKRRTFEFEQPVRFNEGGHGTMIGSVQWEMPLDAENLNALHAKYGSTEAIERELVEKSVNKSVYMTGPLMSSRESFAEKRNYLLNYVEDQISNGVYRTVQREVRVLDPLTQQEKSAVVVEIVLQGGAPVRQEPSAISEFGIKTFNFAIDNLPYDEAVEQQIKEQQQIAMDIQKSISESRKAEQRKITTEQDGAANAAKAKWEQEVIKAQAVTEAQQKLEVAQLTTREAEQYKQATLLRADGDATARRRLMEADGALAQKLEAWTNAQGVWARAFAEYKGAVVPSVVTGSGGNAGGNAAINFMEILGVKAARDLGLDVTPGQTPR